jgi:putative SOS response-associated peptidase YedK
MRILLLGAFPRYTHSAMCGRYTETAAFEELAQRFGITAAPDEVEEAVRPSYNVAPSQAVPIVVRADGDRALRLARWGFKPHWMRESRLAPINARAETVTTSRIFRDAVRRGRCLVPADGFYEWRAVPGQKRKRPYYVRLKGGGLFAFAGLWSPEHADSGTPPSCAILTTSANALVSPIHTRMPVILDPADEERWLDPHLDPAAVRSCLRSVPAERMEAYAVSALVSSPQNDGTELIEPVKEATA